MAVRTSHAASAAAVSAIACEQLIKHRFHLVDNYAERCDLGTRGWVSSVRKSCQYNGRAANV